MFLTASFQIHEAKAVIAKRINISIHNDIQICQHHSLSIIGRKYTMKLESVEMQSWEDPLEKEMATHSSILAWKIP